MPSMMMIDKRNVPERYCERCARTYPASAPKTEAAPRQKVSA